MCYSLSAPENKKQRKKQMANFGYTDITQVDLNTPAGKEVLNNKLNMIHYTLLQIAEWINKTSTSIVDVGTSSDEIG